MIGFRPFTCLLMHRVGSSQFYIPNNKQSLWRIIRDPDLLSGCCNPQNEDQNSLSRVDWELWKQNPTKIDLYDRAKVNRKWNKKKLCLLLRGVFQYSILESWFVALLHRPVDGWRTSTLDCWGPSWNQISTIALPFRGDGRGPLELTIHSSGGVLLLPLVDDVFGDGIPLCCRVIPTEPMCDGACAAAAGRAKVETTTTLTHTGLSSLSLSSFDNWRAGGAARFPPPPKCAIFIPTDASAVVLLTTRWRDCVYFDFKKNKLKPRFFIPLFFPFPH